MAKELLVGKNGNKRTTEFFTWLNGLKYRVIEGYTWKNGLCYQFYGEDGLIPKMTSNTLPYGVASAGDGILNSEAYYAYDRETNTWVGASAENQYGYVIYEFDRKVNIERVVVTACRLSMGGIYEKNFTIKVSVYYENDWHEYGTFVIEDYHGVVFVWKDYTLANGKVYNIEKIKTETLTEKTYGSSYHISKIQAYGEYSKTRYVYYYGTLMNVSPNASLSDIVNVNTAAKESQAILDKKIAWMCTNYYNYPPYTEVDKEIVTPNLTPYTRDSSSYADTLFIPIDRELLSTTSGVDNTPITIRINCKASVSNGYFSAGFIQVRNSGNYYYFSSSQKITVTFGNSQGEYPLNTYQDVDFVLPASSANEVRTNSYYNVDGYTFFMLSAPVNYGVSPVLNIRSIEIRTVSIKSSLYPNANVYRAGIISTNNGSRTPTSKYANGDAVAFCVRNGGGTGYGGNWMVTVCVALTEDAARLDATGTGSSVANHTINGVTYYVSQQGSNSSYGGATEISSPIGLPIFDDWQVCSPAFNPAVNQQQLTDIIQTLDIRVQ